MFGNDKANAASHAKRGATAKDTGVTILTAGCHFSGKLYCRGATRIGGTIEGQVIAEGLLVIEEEAVVNGDIDAEDIVVHGRVEGKIDGRNRIEMCPTADVQADVSTPSLVVHDGALFNGRTAMKRAAKAAADADTKGSTSRRFGGRKLAEVVAAPEAGHNAADGRAARIGDVSFHDLEPEPAI